MPCQLGWLHAGPSAGSHLCPSPRAPVSRHISPERCPRAGEREMCLIDSGGAATSLGSGQASDLLTGHGRPRGAGLAPSFNPGSQHQ